MFVPVQELPEFLLLLAFLQLPVLLQLVLQLVPRHLKRLILYLQK